MMKKNRILDALKKYDPGSINTDFTGPCRIGKIRLENHLKRKRRGL